MNQLERRGELEQTARVVLDRLRAELSSVYPVQLTASADEQASLGSTTQVNGLTFIVTHDSAETGARTDALAFTATLHGAERGLSAARAERGTSASGRGDLVEVRYRLQPGTGLVRQLDERPGLAADEAEPRSEVLTPLATSFGVLCYADAQRPDGSGPGWVDDWQDAHILPAAVTLRLGLTSRRAGSQGAAEQVFEAVIPLPMRAPRQPLTKPQPASGEATPAAPTSATSPTGSTR